MPRRRAPRPLGYSVRQIWIAISSPVCCWCPPPNMMLAQAWTDFPSFSPNRYSTKSYTDRSNNRSTFDKIVRHFNTYGFPQPLQGRDVGPIQDWRFLSSDTNSRAYEVEKADRFIGDNFGRVLYWLICSAHRMPSGMAIIAYYDQHINLIRWFGARFGYRVIRTNGDLNLSGNHMQMTKKMRSIFDTWLIIMPSESSLARRASAARYSMLQQPQPQPAPTMQQPTAPMQAIPEGTAAATRPHASTVQSASSSTGISPQPMAAGQGSPADLQHPSRANTLPSSIPHATAHRLSSAGSIPSSEISTQPGGSHGQVVGVPGTPSTTSPPMSPPVHSAGMATPSRQTSMTSTKPSSTAPEGSVNMAAVQAPFHPKTIAMQKLEDVASTYNLTYVPLCNRFLQTPFPSLEAIQKEHAVISEGLMAQVILKLDDVDIQGDEVARIRRKGLIEEIQYAQGKVDDRLKLANEMNAGAQTGAQAGATVTSPVQPAAQGSAELPQAGISRVYTNPPAFHSTVNPAELAAGLGFVELPASMSPAAVQPAAALPKQPQPVEAPANPASKPPAVRRRAPPPPRKVILATALFDFEPEEADGEELTFKEGDTIEIVEKSKTLEEDGWCRARVKGQRKLGLAPLEYLEELPNQPALPAKAPPKPKAPAAEVEGENAPAPGEPVTALGEKPLFMSPGARDVVSPAAPIPSAGGFQSAVSGTDQTQPVNPSAASASGSSSQPISTPAIQPVSVTQFNPNGSAHGAGTGAQGPPDGNPDATTTPPPPYIAVQEHASLVGGGSAAQYYDASAQMHAAPGDANAPLARGGKILTPTPPGITNPNHNAGTYFATHMFNRPQKKDSSGDQMSPGDQTTMRGLPTAEARPSAPHAGSAAGRPQGQSPPPGSQGPGIRPAPGRQPSGPDTFQKIGAISGVLNGVGQIMSATSGRNDGGGGGSHHCGGCGHSSCSGCNAHGGPGGSDVQVNQTVNANTTNTSYQSDVSQQAIVDSAAYPVSSVDPSLGGQGSFTSASAGVAYEPSVLGAAPTIDATQSPPDAVSPVPTFLSTEPTSFISPPETPVPAPSPLAGLSPLADSATTIGVSGGSSVSPLAGLARAPTTSDASYFASTTTTADNGDLSGATSPLASLAAVETTQTTSPSGETETTTAAVAVDGQGDMVAAVETDVSGAPVDGGGGTSGVAVAEDYSGGGWGGGDWSSGFDSGGGGGDF